MEEEFVEPFTLHLQLLTTNLKVWTTAFIDSGVDCNVMTYETWEKLGKPQLKPSTLSFESFSGTNTHNMGTLCIKAQIQDTPTQLIFHVAPQSQKTWDVILGHPWIGSHDLQINWISREYILNIDSVSVRGKSSELETKPNLHLVEHSESQETNPSPSIPSQWIQDENNLKHGWYVSTSLLHSQGYGKGERHIT